MRTIARLYETHSGKLYFISLEETHNGRYESLDFHDAIFFALCCSRGSTFLMRGWTAHVQAFGSFVEIHNGRYESLDFHDVMMFCALQPARNNLNAR